MLPQTKNEDDETYSVFIAGASDCDSLRSSAKACFELHNQVLPGGKSKFVVFDWKEHKSPGHTDGKFQEQVFEDAERHWGKSHCDILVLLLWHKFGPDTQREYDFYTKRAEDGKISQLFVCHYNEPVPPLALMESRIDQLFEWIKEPRKDWAEIRPERGTVDDAIKFNQALTKQILSFLREPSSQ